MRHYHTLSLTSGFALVQRTQVSSLPKSPSVSSRHSHGRLHSLTRSSLELIPEYKHKLNDRYTLTNQANLLVPGHQDHLRSLRVHHFPLTIANATPFAPSRAQHFYPVPLFLSWTMRLTLLTVIVTLPGGQ